MKTLLLVFLLSVSIGYAADVDPNPVPLKLLNGKSYEQWSVMSQTRTSIVVKHNGGATKVMKDQLPPELLALYPIFADPLEAVDQKKEQTDKRRSVESAAAKTSPALSESFVPAPAPMAAPESSVAPIPAVSDGPSNPILAKGDLLTLTTGRQFKNWRIERHTSATVFVTTSEGSVEIDRRILPEPVASRFPFQELANISQISPAEDRPTQEKNGMRIMGAAHDIDGGILISVRNINSGSQSFDYRGLVAKTIDGEYFEVGDCRPFYVSNPTGKSRVNTDPTLTLGEGQTRLMILTFTAARSWESLSWKDQSSAPAIPVAVARSYRERSETKKSPIRKK